MEWDWMGQKNMSYGQASRLDTVLRADHHRCRISLKGVGLLAGI